MSNYSINFTATKNNLSNYWATFVTAPLSPESLSATINGEALSASKSYNLSASDVIEVSSFSWQGDMYISTQEFDANTPDFTTNTTNSFQCIEFSGAKASPEVPAFTKPDVSYINWYSIPLMITNTSTNTTYGKPSADFSQLAILDSLKGLSNDTSITVINDDDGNFLRIISPSSGSKYFSTYPSFDDYVNYVFQKEPNDYYAQIRLNNLYDGLNSPATSPTQLRQLYTNYDDINNTAYVYYDGDKLKIKGSSIFLDPINNVETGAISNYEIKAINPAMNNNIYLAQFDYSWEMTYINPNGAFRTYKNPNANIGDNDVFAAMMRDLLAGFAFGFVQSQTINDVANVSYGSEPSSDWQNADGSTLFYDLQSSTVATPPPYYYNSWANVFYQYFSNVYSFPFTDFIGAISPQLQINSGNNLLVTILN